MQMSKVQHDSETLAEGQQVMSAVAFITAQVDGETKVFLAKRADTKKFLPGIYEMPGGHIDYGEQIADGLAREIMEEFGMRAAIGDVFAAFTYMNPIKKSHTIEVVCFGTFLDPIEGITLEPEDHSTYGWFSLAELPDAYTEHKGADDIEFTIARRGFALLAGEPPFTGTLE
jgi:8-oxo-dGTP diphosphatase